MADQIDRLILQDLATATLIKIQQELREAEQELRTLNNELIQGQVAQNVYAQEATQTAARIADLRQQLQGAQVSAGSAATGISRLGTGVLQVGYILDDAQQFSYSFAAGMRAIGNNIPGLLIGLGLGPGLAGVISIVGTAVAVAAPAISKFINSFNTSEIERFGSALEQVEADVKALTEAKLTIAVDTFQLDIARNRLSELKKDQEAYNQATRGTRLQQESARQLGELLAEAPGGEQNLRDRLRAQALRDVLANPGSQFSVARQEARRAEAVQAQAERELFAPGAGEGEALAFQLAQKRAEQARQRAEQARRDAEKNAELTVGGLLRQATEAGPDIEAAQRRLADQIRRLGGREFAQFAENITGRAFPGQGLVGGVSPTALKAAEEEDRITRQEEEDNRAAREFRERRERASREAEREAERRAGELAKNISPQLDREALVGLPVGADRVRDLLQKTQGLSPDEANAIAEDVLGKIQENLKQALRKKAGEAGVSVEEAGALLFQEREITRTRGGAREAQAERRLGLTGPEGGLIGPRGVGGPFAQSVTYSSGLDLSRSVQQAILSAGGSSEQKETNLHLRELIEYAKETAQAAKNKTGGQQTANIAIESPG